MLVLYSLQSKQSLHLSSEKDQLPLEYPERLKLEFSRVKPDYVTYN